MSEKEQDKNQETETCEAQHNLLSFFSLLLEIDKRENPELYKKSQENDD